MIHLISVDCWWRCTHSSHSQTSINSQGEQCGRTSSRFVLHFGLILLFSGHRLTLKNINNKFIVSIDEKAGQCKWLPTAVCFSSITTNVLQHGSILDPEDRRLYPVNCKISKHLKDIWTSLEKKKKRKKKKKSFLSLVVSKSGLRRIEAIKRRRWALYRKGGKNVFIPMDVFSTSITVNNAPFCWRFEHVQGLVNTLQLLICIRYADYSMGRPEAI